MLRGFANGRFLNLRRWNSNASTSISNGADKGFVTKRRIYQNQLSGIRKEFQEEVTTKQYHEKLDREAARKQTILQKAMLLREKKKAQVIRTELHMLRLQASRERFQENLALSLARRASKDEKQQKRYDALLADFNEEKNVWITPDNINSLITHELFDKPSTTGLTTKHSDYWRYHVQSMRAKRLEMLSEEDADYYPDAPATRGLAEKKYKAGFKLNVHDLLLPMVGTGEDRARFKELVDRFTDALADIEGDQEDMTEYLENEKEFNQDNESYGYTKYREDLDGTTGEYVVDEGDHDDLQDDYFRGLDEDSAAAETPDADDLDDGLEGAVSIIANKDAREIALKAYKTRKAVKKAGKRGKA